MRFSVHAPYAADPAAREGAAAIRRSIDFAGDVAAGVVNIHLFARSGRAGVRRRPGPAAGGRAGRRRAAEPGEHPRRPRRTTSTPSSASSRRCPRPRARVGMCLDMGHANLHAGTRNDYLRLRRPAGRHVPIVHWHAHENWGDRDSHLTLFTGPSARDDRGLRGLVRRLLRRGFRGSVVLEQWPHPPGLLVEALIDCGGCWTR